MLRFCVAVPLSAAVALAVIWHDRPAAQEVEFSEAYLSDEENIQHGRDLWRQQCVQCHGSRAYPGKAPKLQPQGLTPEEIYLKTTYGFGRMPAWEDVFSDEERKAITAYMKSDIFSP